MKRYLAIETRNEYDNFIHFIDLKGCFADEIKSLLNHLSYFLGQVVTKVYFSDSKLTNW